MTTWTFNAENSSRRDFIRKGLTLGVGATLSSLNTNNAQGQSLANNTEKSKKLMALFNLKYPIFQAAPGGEKLAIAIANTGGMGAIGLNAESVERVKASTRGSFYCNFILSWGDPNPESLDKVLEAGPTAIEFSWGIPSKETVSKIKSSTTKLGIQVASKNGAKAALDLGADFLFCQGVEAGGHVQAYNALYDELKEVLEVSPDIPVLAAGGIATGHDIRKALNAGASGVVIGTRFIATQESDIHDEYKKSLVQAGENSTVFTNCFNKLNDGDWSAMHRVLRNNTFEMWEAAGCPLPGNRPGEKDIIATRPDGSTLERYSLMPPVQGLQGQVTELAMYAGQGVSKVKDLPTASDLIQRLWKEYENK
jgi:nitronate monooxygenase